MFLEYGDISSGLRPRHGKFPAGILLIFNFEQHRKRCYFRNVFLTAILISILEHFFAVADDISMEKQNPFINLMISVFILKLKISDLIFNSDMIYLSNSTFPYKRFTTLLHVKAKYSF